MAITFVLLFYEKMKLKQVYYLLRTKNEFCKKKY